MKEDLFVDKMATYSLVLVFCKLHRGKSPSYQRKTSRQFFVDKVIARSRRSEVSSWESYIRY